MLQRYEFKVRLNGQQVILLIKCGRKLSRYMTKKRVDQHSRITPLLTQAAIDLKLIKVVDGGYAPLVGTNKIGMSKSIVGYFIYILNFAKKTNLVVSPLTDKLLATFEQYN